VEWTGAVSGDWFQVRGPGNQIGWIHRSGLSTPRTAPTSQEQPATASQTTTSSSRATTPRTSASTLEKQISELEKTNAQYKALLDEKERRVAELTQEIEAVEQKLLDTAQEANDSQQMREMQQVQVSEIESRLNELKDTLKQKDEELLKGKVELTKLQNQLANLQEQAQQARPTERLILYGLNGLLIFLFVSVVFLYIRRKKTLEQAAALPLVSDQPPSVPDEQSGEGVQESQDLASSPPTTVVEEEVEDVVIELSDVLPATDLEASEEVEGIEEVEDVEIISENDIEEVDIIEEVEVIEEPDVIEELDTLEEVEEIEETDILEEIEMIRDDEDDEIDELVDVDIVEVVDESGKGTGSVSLYEELEERESCLGPVEEEVGSDFDFDAIYNYEADEIIADLEEPAVEPEPVEVGGETFEMLVEQSTQIIRVDEDEELEEEVLSAPKAFEDIPDLEPAEQFTLKEEIEDLSDLLEAREMDLEEIHTYRDVDGFIDEETDEFIEDLDESEVQIVIDEEVEEFEEIDDLEVIEEIDDGVFEAEEEPVFEAIDGRPDFLEPSPVLIEPEYEPVEIAPPPKKDTRPISRAPRKDTYEIELIEVGENKERIVEVLSKVRGLPKSPAELVQNIPTIITRDAKETDAKNFQILMQKLGAKVRVIKH